ncbi:hypothetical protein L596_012156 [Steinernema carpocapsae]|uniref:Uncharacterized protein n=1 Tax=Steinernema carpocapsae TaxID=34508 RepID=A0A4V6A4Q1_STECR|nr:hypothetical protein L596_012156 [Steinernema carpocapsae]
MTGAKERNSSNPPPRPKKSADLKILEMKTQMRKLDAQFDDLQKNPKRGAKLQPISAMSVATAPKTEDAKRTTETRSRIQPASEIISKISTREPALMTAEASSAMSHVRSAMLPSVSEAPKEPPKKKSPPKKTSKPKVPKLDHMTTADFREEINKLELTLATLKKNDCGIPEVKAKIGFALNNLDELKRRLRELDEKCALFTIHMKDRMEKLCERRQRSLAKLKAGLTKNEESLLNTKRQMAHLEDSIQKNNANNSVQGPYIAFSEMSSQWEAYLFARSTSTASTMSRSESSFTSGGTSSSGTFLGSTTSDKTCKSTLSPKPSLTTRKDVPKQKEGKKPTEKRFNAAK